MLESSATSIREKESEEGKEGGREDRREGREMGGGIEGERKERLALKHC